jgi:protein SCO1
MMRAVSNLARTIRCIARATRARLLLAMLLCAFTLPTMADAELPGDSVYQLALPLTDQSGRPTTWLARRGQPQLVAMFYTSCPFMCPLIIDTARAVEQALSPSQRAGVGVLLISLDPRRDTPQHLRELATQRQLDLQRWTLAQPRPQDVRAIAGVLGVRYRALANGEFNHSSVLILLDADGRIRARTEQMGRVEPAFLAAVQDTLAAEPTPGRP